MPSSSAPKNSLRKLVYDAEEPSPSISFTNSPIVPQRQPVMNILIILLSSILMYSLSVFFQPVQAFFIRDGDVVLIVVSQLFVKL